MAEHDLNKIVDDEGEVFNLRDSTKQPTADRVTSWSSTPSDTKYPSEKLVKTSLDAKADDSAVLHKAGLETASGQKWFEGGFCVFNSSHIGYGHFTLAGAGCGPAYNDWTEEQKDGAHFREWSLSFNSGVNFWGKIRITIATSYSSFNASGSIQKTINCAFNTMTVFNNTGYYNDLGINSENEFRISDLIWNNTTECWEIKIHSIKPTSNNGVPVLLIEFWTYSTPNRDSALGIHWVSTSPSIVTDTTYYTKRSGNASTSPGTGGVQFNWADKPVQQSPYGYEIFNRSHTIPVANGGTGKTTAKAAEYNLTTGKSEISDATSGDDRVVFELASPSESNGVTRGFRKLSTIWTWIKGLLSSESGVNISGNAATATKATQDSDGNAINATYFKSSGNTTLVAGAATKIGTQNGADVKLTLPAHQDISGKMATNGSNATASAGGNIIRAMGNWDDPDETKEAIPAADITSGGITQGRYTFGKIWNWIISHTKVKLLKAASESWIGVGTDESHYIELDYDGTASSPTMGIWARWADGSGNAKYMAECNTSGDCKFNGSSESVAGIDAGTRNTSTYRLSLGYTTSLQYDGHARAIVTLHCDSALGSAGDGIGVTVLVSVDWKGNSTNRHVSARVLNNDAFASNILPGVLVFNDANGLLHFCVVLLGKSSNSTDYELKPFNFTSTSVVKLGGTMNWQWDIQHDSVSTISSSDFVFPAEDCVTHVCQPPSSVIGAGSPAADCAAYWTNYVGKGCVKTVYNNNGQEYTLLFSKSADGLYGTILRWSYRGPNNSDVSRIEMLRCYNGSFLTSDWEGLSVDNATNATNAGNADTVDGYHFAMGSYGGVANTIYFG